MIDLKKLIAVSRPPSDPKEWLADAEAGVDYLLSQASEDETIIYASLSSTLVHGVLALRKNVTPPDHDDLLQVMIMPDATWSITHVSGGGQPDRVYLAPPLDRHDGKSLVGGETLVVRRRFELVDKGKSRTEVSQKLVHSLNLYWRDEESAYCRFDDNGDIEPVLRVTDLERLTGDTSGILVTIKTRDLARYMVVTDTVLLTKFDFTRVILGSFTRGRSQANTRHAARTSSTMPLLKPMQATPMAF